MGAFNNCYIPQLKDFLGEGERREKGRRRGDLLGKSPDFPFQNDSPIQADVHNTKRYLGQSGPD